MRRILILAAIAALLFAVPVGGVRAKAAAAPKIKLAVVVIVDQMRADYLDRFADYFGPDGFQRLTGEGRRFSQARYSHLTTFTGPGHSLVGSGLYGDKSGIVGNRWYARELGRNVNCAYGLMDPATPGKCLEAVPAAGAAADVPGNPCNALGISLAQRVKKRYPAARVVGLGMKDRSAILPAGKDADAAYWIDESGDAPTLKCSEYYPACHPDVIAFNTEMASAALFARYPEWKTWSCSLPERCEKACPDDIADFHGEDSGLGKGFPHSVKDTTAVLGTPYGDDLLESLAERIVASYDLGHNPAAAPDVLTIGFSSTDYFGHTFGPDSCEVADGFKRLDATLARLLTFLEKKIGREHLLVVLTADHGVTSMPEVSLKRGIPAGRINLGDGASRSKGKIGDMPAIRQRMEFELARKLSIKEDGSTPLMQALILTYQEPSLYLNREAVGEGHLAFARKALKVYLMQVEGVEAVYTSEEIATGRVPEYVKLSYMPERSGDLIIVLKRDWIDMGNTGTTHGQPWDADSRVPLLFWGTGVSAGTSEAPTDIAQIAPTLAAVLGLDGSGFSHPGALSLSIHH